MSADFWWDDARRQARRETIKRSSREDWSDERYRSVIAAINSPQWVPERDERRMPSKWAIASYWAERDDWFDVILDQPHCFACHVRGGYPEDEPDLKLRWNRARRLERGHIVNWARHGLDGVQNLVPLCRDCNHFMPVFGVEDDVEATAWIFSGGIADLFERRLEAEGLNWAERGLAWLAWMESRGGIAFPAGLDQHCYERLLLRLLPGAA